MSTLIKKKKVIVHPLKVFFDTEKAKVTGNLITAWKPNIISLFKNLNQSDSSEFKSSLSY